MSSRDCGRQQWSLLPHVPALGETGPGPALGADLRFPARRAQGLSRPGDTAAVSRHAPPEPNAAAGPAAPFGSRALTGLSTAATLDAGRNRPLWLSTTASGVGQHTGPRRQPSAPFIGWIRLVAAPAGDIIKST